MNTRNKGFIKQIILVLALLIVLGYFFKFDIKEFLTSAETVAKFSNVWHFILGLWNDFVIRPILFVWNKL